MPNVCCKNKKMSNQIFEQFEKTTLYLPKVAFFKAQNDVDKQT